MSARDALPEPALDEIDRRIIQATQAGLPLTPRPYHAVAERLGLTAELVMARMAAMLEKGVIRRIGGVPTHYALGLTLNGMTVWAVDDVLGDERGEAVGGLPLDRHCYGRPRRRPCGPTTCSPWCTQKAGSRRKPTRTRSPPCWATPAASPTSSTAAAS